MLDLTLATRPEAGIVRPVVTSLMSCDVRLINFMLSPWVPLVISYFNTNGLMISSSVNGWINGATVAFQSASLLAGMFKLVK